MTVADLVGDFSIIGSNQNDSDVNYRGVLTLSLDEDNRIIAKWLIHNEQEQVGSGFFKDNILVINFQYLGENSEIFNGTVVYRCLNKDILDGFWSEEYGNPRFIGTERCFRIKENSDVS
ncbi:hypothetical protein EV195_10282 [Tenacibaculum skagerrakense]|uniref:Uncharacterized protein n=1 Tax=Tenacibaculum skagerrakense TaxID=186571 RepID=A0A4R2NX45_9FLAO|nr:hypothetical protein [Tenacibaculum skagerrakense]TCP26743.1 hypothetical protein EV195_10282 [Tenacibaculum skagerrakense]